MNLPLYSPSEPASGWKRGRARGTAGPFPHVAEELVMRCRRRWLQHSTLLEIAFDRQRRGGRFPLLL
jgi:hypothetical protein